MNKTHTHTHTLLDMCSRESRLRSVRCGKVSDPTWLSVTGVRTEVCVGVCKSRNAGKTRPRIPLLNDRWPSCLSCFLALLFFRRFDTRFFDTNDRSKVRHLNAIFINNDGRTGRGHVTRARTPAQSSAFPSSPVRVVPTTRGVREGLFVPENDV